MKWSGLNGALLCSGTDKKGKVGKGVASALEVLNFWTFLAKNSSSVREISVPC